MVHSKYLINFRWNPVTIKWNIQLFLMSAGFAVEKYWLCSRDNGFEIRFWFTKLFIKFNIPTYGHLKKIKQKKKIIMKINLIVKSSTKKE